MIFCYFYPILIFLKFWAKINFFFWIVLNFGAKIGNLLSKINIRIKVQNYSIFKCKNYDEHLPSLPAADEEAEADVVSQRLSTLLT
jgi:hypothetical protein